VNTALRRSSSLLALFSAASFFLWMFLAVAPIEALADAHGLVDVAGADPLEQAYRFAADWRHGMAGNSPLYMPGFFALAGAAWVWSSASRKPRTIRQLVWEGAGVLVGALAAAWTASHATGTIMVPVFERTAGVQVIAPWPDIPRRAILQGLCTAAAWMTVVVACRRALARRSVTPLLVIPPITIVLIMVRPWTVNDFVGLWLARAAAGEIVALGSLFAVPLVGWSLAMIERPPHWVQIHLKHRRMRCDV
jgi:hypothetical protein